MGRIPFLVAFFSILISTVSYANGVDYSNCRSIREAIARETQEISATHPADHDELAQLIEALITRGMKCCQAGGFWKACVAPITRKWREWKNNKERSVLPNAQNLPLYVN